MAFAHKLTRQMRIEGSLEEPTRCKRCNGRFLKSDTRKNKPFHHPKRKYHQPLVGAIICAQCHNELRGKE